MATETKEKKSTAAKNFQPLGDRVFVTYTEEMERTSGGIYVPDSAKEKPQRGNVQAVGKKVENVKVGDQVLFDKYSGSKLRIDDEECLIPQGKRDILHRRIRSLLPGVLVEEDLIADFDVLEPLADGLDITSLGFFFRGIRDINPAGRPFPFPRYRSRKPDRRAAENSLQPWTSFPSSA